MNYNFKYKATLEFAQEMDKKDPLAKFRAEFDIPMTFDNPKFIYFVGNSLGAKPKKADEYIQEELNKWEKYGAYGHFNEPNPWVSYGNLVKEQLGKVLGAEPSEIIAKDTLTANLHFLFTSFYKIGKKNKILIENDPFPSDIDAVNSQIQVRHFHINDLLSLKENEDEAAKSLTNYFPEDLVIQLQPEQDKLTVSTDYICEIIKKHKDELSLVFLSGVHYLTGQAYDIKAITEEAHKHGIKAGFDLAHWAGNIDSKLHEWGVDFAAWCNYKYLNAGPGAIGGLFVHEDYHKKLDIIPRFKGWFGRDISTRFDMGQEHVPTENAEAWQVSNPNIFSLASLRASLDIFEQATMKTIREKSVLLTGYLEFLLDHYKLPDIEIITPANPEDRGSQLSLKIHDNKGQYLLERLKEQGAGVDFRVPDIIRVAPVPLYNTFEEVFRFVDILKQK